MHTHPRLEPRALALAAAVAALAIAAAPTPAWAGPKQVRFIGIHPIAASAGGGLCHIEAPHVHVYGADKLQYRDHRGHHYFVGDPVAYGYDGPRFVYKGHHPIRVDLVVHADEPDEEFCYLDGPHYHSFAPPPGPQFEVVGDAHFYVAPPPKVYVEARPVFIGINAVYRPLVYSRPVIEVAAPAGWIGARAELIAPVVVAPPPPVVRGGVGIDVYVPVPSVHIDVGIGVGGGVIVGGPPRRYPPKHKKHKKHKGHDRDRDD
jgi:hypothetical protein